MGRWVGDLSKPHPTEARWSRWRHLVVEMQLQDPGPHLGQSLSRGWLAAGLPAVHWPWRLAPARHSDRGGCQQFLALTALSSCSPGQHGHFLTGLGPQLTQDSFAVVSECSPPWHDVQGPWHPQPSPGEQVATSAHLPPSCGGPLSINTKSHWPRGLLWCPRL